MRIRSGFSRKRGFEQVYLWVLDENANARRFYEQHGFELDGCECFVEIAGKQLREVSYAKRNKLD